MKRVLKIAVFVLAGMLSINQAFAVETLNGAGSSFAYPIYSAWAYAYQKVAGTQLNYQSIGSGGGIKQITERTVDFGASDLPLSPANLKKSNLIQFPAVIGGVVPIVNIPGVKPDQMRLDSQTMCGIYLGDIKFWDDAQIKALNPDDECCPTTKSRSSIGPTARERPRSSRITLSKPAPRGRIKSAPARP